MDSRLHVSGYSAQTAFAKCFGCCLLIFRYYFWIPMAILVLFIRRFISDHVHCCLFLCFFCLHSSIITKPRLQCSDPIRQNLKRKKLNEFGWIQIYWMDFNFIGRICCCHRPMTTDYRPEQMCSKLLEFGEQRHQRQYNHSFENCRNNNENTWKW